MRRRTFLVRITAVGSAAAAAPLHGQLPEIDFEEVLEQAQAWAVENLDDSLLKSLETLDTGQVREFLEELERRFHAEYVLDLAALKDGAKTILPLLESREETEPYAIWLRTRLDYLKLAEELSQTLPTPPKPEPGKPAPKPPVPTPEQQRTVWKKEMSVRVAPAAAQTQLEQLKTIFKSEGVPAQLVWLAEVESSFNPKARSPVGAAGLYQLMPATAKQYGLSLWPRDQRLQPERNAQASARYLRALHNRFKDWPLTLAAYNAGEGSVQKALGRSQNKTFNGIAPKLPAETQMYVPKVSATLVRREGISLAELPRG